MRLQPRSNKVMNSKIAWTSVITTVVGAAAMSGQIPQEMVEPVATTVMTLGGALTFIFRKWFNAP